MAKYRGIDQIYQSQDRSQRLLDVNGGKTTLSFLNTSMDVEHQGVGSLVRVMEPNRLAFTINGGTTHIVGSDSADGSDNRKMVITSASADDTSRSGVIRIHGNENSGNSGEVHIVGGEVSGANKGRVVIQTSQNSIVLNTINSQDIVFQPNQNEIFRLQGSSGKFVYNGTLNIISNTLDAADSGGILIGGGGAEGITRGAVLELFGNERSALHGDANLRSGTSGNVTLWANSGLINLNTAGSNRWRVNQSGHIEPWSNNAYSVGSNALRVKTVYADTIDANTISGSAQVFPITNNTYINWRNAANNADVDVLKLGDNDHVYLSTVDNSHFIILDMPGFGTQAYLKWGTWTLANETHSIAYHDDTGYIAIAGGHQALDDYGAYINLYGNSFTSISKRGTIEIKAGDDSNGGSVSIKPGNNRGWFIPNNASGSTLYFESDNSLIGTDQTGTVNRDLTITATTAVNVNNSPYIQVIGNDHFTLDQGALKLAAGNVASSGRVELYTGANVLRWYVSDTGHLLPGGTYNIGSSGSRVATVAAATVDGTGGDLVLKTTSAHSVDIQSANGAIKLSTGTGTATLRWIVDSSGNIVPQGTTGTLDVGSSSQHIRRIYVDEILGDSLTSLGNKVRDNDEWTYWRNSADDNDEPIIKLDTNDDLIINNDLSDIIFRTLGNHRWIINSSGHLLPFTSLNIGGTSNKVNAVYSDTVYTPIVDATGDNLILRTTSANSVEISAYNGAIKFYTGTGSQVFRWAIDAGGHYLPQTASAHDIGSTTLPVRKLYAGTVEVDEIISTTFTGIFPIANDTAITWRNAADDGDIEVIKLSSSDETILLTEDNATPIKLRVDPAVTNRDLTVGFDGGTYINVSTNGMNLNIGAGASYSTTYLRNGFGGSSYLELNSNYANLGTNRYLQIRSNDANNDDILLDIRKGSGQRVQIGNSTIRFYYSGQITSMTSDGSDDRTFTMTAAGAVGADRGSFIRVSGNENSSYNGRVHIVSGVAGVTHICGDNASNPVLILQHDVGSETLWRFNHDGTIEQDAYGGDLIYNKNFQIKANTSDGSDDLYVALLSGGDSGSGRGSSLYLFGNDNSSQPGDAFINSGSEGDVYIRALGASSIIRLRSGGDTDRWQVKAAGHIIPVLNKTYDIGEDTLRVRKLFVEDVDVSGTIDTGGDSSVITWESITGTSHSMEANKAYIVNNAALVTLTLPSACAVGKVIRLTGVGAGGWKITQNTDQKIHLGDTSTTTGTGGSISSTHQRDAIELVCVVEDEEFNVISSLGSLDVV